MTGYLNCEVFLSDDIRTDSVVYSSQRGCRGAVASNMIKAIKLVRAEREREKGAGGALLGLPLTRGGRGCYGVLVSGES